jgi:hypothetical protein
MTRSRRSGRPVQMKLSAQNGGVERQEKTRYQSIRPPLTTVQGGLLLGDGDGGRELGTELLFSQKIAQVLVEADQRAHSTLSIEKGRAVLYGDFVTILRDASIQYITKLATSKSQKPAPSQHPSCHTW